MLNGEDLMDKSIMLNKSEYGLMVSRMLSGQINHRTVRLGSEKLADWGDKEEKNRATSDNTVVKSEF